MDLFEAVNESYGVDPDGPIPVDDDDGQIVIPQIPLKFRSTDLAILHQQVNPQQITMELIYISKLLTLY